MFSGGQGIEASELGYLKDEPDIPRKVSRILINVLAKDYLL